MLEEGRPPPPEIGAGNSTLIMPARLDDGFCAVQLLVQ